MPATVQVQYGPYRYQRTSYSPEYLLLMIAGHRVQKAVKFTHPLSVDESVANARIETPRELVARICRCNLLYVSIMHGHQQLRAQCAIVHVPRPHKQRPQKLKHHVVQTDVAADHLGQFLDNISLAAGLWQRREEHRRGGAHVKQRRLLHVNVSDTQDRLSAVMIPPLNGNNITQTWYCRLLNSCSMLYNVQDQVMLSYLTAYVLYYCNTVGWTW